uniref:Uncharacterized protein n=1 Tax=Rhizophora mucronata TaxID=61149 RepID=A0A2P2QJ58_RHIMU
MGQFIRQSSQMEVQLHSGC